MLARSHSGIIFLGANADACCLWREYFPHLNMPGSGFACFTEKPKFERILSYDVAVVQRCCTKAQLEFIDMMKRCGLKVVYDLDDQIWKLPKYNPAYAVLHQHREGFTACIQYVDLVTVSTPKLARAVRSHVKDLHNKMTGKEIPVVVVENRIDQRVFAQPQFAEKTIVGWAGSSSHIGDLPIISAAIKELANEHPEVLFEFRGCNPSAEAANADMPQTEKDALLALHDLSNFRHVLWSPVAEYNARMPLWGWCLALAPVQDEVFNEAKSNIKMIEAGYCGIPCLASWVDPYESFVRHDKELEYLLCAGPSSWLRKIRELINDVARREYLGKRMKAVVDQYYTWDRPHEGWQKALEIINTL